MQESYPDNEIQSRMLLIMVPEIDILVPGKLNFPFVVFESPVPPEAMTEAIVRTRGVDNNRVPKVTIMLLQIPKKQLIKQKIYYYYPWGDLMNCNKMNQIRWKYIVFPPTDCHLMFEVLLPPYL
jgi:hypothetical protein